MLRAVTVLVLSGFLPLYIACGLGQAVAGVVDEAYQVQAGDVLIVSVWKEENMQREVLVRPDGQMSFPLVGSLQASGKTIPELQEEISKQLTKYIPDPVVTVEARNLSGNVIYVIGKVARPGPFQVGRYIDVTQALSMAGGTTTYAGVNKIKILRRQNGALTATPFKYGEIEKGEHLEQNIILKAGDVVLVP